MRFDLPDDKTFVHESLTPIRWGDMDAMGHVNNAVYFRYMEIARIDWLQAIGAAPNPRGEGPVIVNAFCNFLRQVSYPGELRLRHYAGRPGRSSLDTYITIERSDEPGVLQATGGATLVWFDAQAQKSAPLPERLLRAVGG